MSSGFSSESFLFCKQCRMAFASKLPSEDELSFFYSIEARNTPLSLLTAANYRNWIQEWKVSGIRSHLDFGCGQGDLVRLAQSLGINSLGTEIDALVCRKLSERGLPILEFTKILDQNMKFDLVTAIEVIEHVSNPEKVLNDISRTLKKGGILNLTTPNFDSLNRRILRHNWRAFSYPEHLQLFTSRSLLKLFQKSHLKVLKIETTGHIVLDTKKTTKSISVMNTIPRIERQRAFYEKNLSTRMLKDFLNANLTRLNLGDTIKLVAQKAT